MPLLSRTGLPVETNREIWRLARFFGPRGGDHNLSEVGFMVMNRLVAHAQAGRPLNASLIYEDAPALPRYDGFEWNGGVVKVTQPLEFN